jgi:hypothetical protein
VPFLVEDERKRLGGLYERVPDWPVYTIVDGRLTSHLSHAIQNARIATSQVQSRTRLDDFYNGVLTALRETETSHDSYNAALTNGNAS